MATMTAEDVRIWQESIIVDRDGNKVGKIEDIYYDEATGRPEWALVNTGMFGMKHNFVPVTGDVTPVDGRVMVQWTEQQIKDAPAIDSNEELSVQEERRLYEHYGLSTDSSQSSSLYATPEGTGQGTQAMPSDQPGTYQERRTYDEQRDMGSDETYRDESYGRDDYGTAGGGVSSSGLQEAPPISRERSQMSESEMGERSMQRDSSMQSDEYQRQQEYGTQSRPTGPSGTESFSSTGVHRPGELTRLRRTIVEEEISPSSEERSSQSERRNEEGGRSGREW